MQQETSDGQGRNFFLAAFGAYTLYKMYEGPSSVGTRNADKLRSERILRSAPKISAERY